MKKGPFPVLLIAFAIWIALSVSTTETNFAKIEHPKARTFLVPVFILQRICLKYMSNGFWFIPFSDIDIYLEAASH